MGRQAGIILTHSQILGSFLGAQTTEPDLTDRQPNRRTHDANINKCGRKETPVLIYFDANSDWGSPNFNVSVIRQVWGSSAMPSSWNIHGRSDVQPGVESACFGHQDLLDRKRRTRRYLEKRFQDGFSGPLPVWTRAQWMMMLSTAKAFLKKSCYL